jgi:two-component system response regulator ChvI
MKSKLWQDPGFSNGEVAFSPKSCHNGSMSRIAVVDDEKNIREALRIALEKEFYQVEEYADGLAAWEVFQGRLPDLIILDILMPRMDGIELCKKIRALKTAGLPQPGIAVPIIFLSSRDEEIDKVLGLESGADDYVCKPFSIRELTARIRAGLRRIPGAAGPAEYSGEGGETAAGNAAALTVGELVLDEDRGYASWKGRALVLTVTEFRILRCLAGQPGYIRSRDQLMAAAFPEDSFPNDRAADSHIKRIRKKLLDLDRNFAELEAVYGLGYRWQEPAGDPVLPAAARSKADKAGSR